MKTNTNLRTHQNNIISIKIMLKIIHKNNCSYMHFLASISRLCSCSDNIYIHHHQCIVTILTIHHIPVCSPRRARGTTDGTPCHTHRTVSAGQGSPSHHTRCTHNACTCESVHPCRNHSLASWCVPVHHQSAHRETPCSRYETPHQQT